MDKVTPTGLRKSLQTAEYAHYTDRYGNVHSIRTNMPGFNIDKQTARIKALRKK